MIKDQLLLVREEMVYGSLFNQTSFLFHNTAIFSPKWTLQSHITKTGFLFQCMGSIGTQSICPVASSSNLEWCTCHRHWPARSYGLPSLSFLWMTWSYTPLLYCLTPSQIKEIHIYIIFSVYSFVLMWDIQINIFFRHGAITIRVFSRTLTLL